MMLNTPKNFTTAIENIAKEKKITHMEAVLWYCEKEGIEPDAVGYLISKGLKQKIEANIATVANRPTVSVIRRERPALLF